MGEIPFQTVYLHGLVRVGTVKMSKSLGNVVSPVDFIAEYGADALRYALVHGIAAGADSQLSQEKLDHARNFGNKVWNISRLALKQVDEHPDPLKGPTAAPAPLDAVHHRDHRAAALEASREIGGGAFARRFGVAEGRRA